MAYIANVIFAPVPGLALRHQLDSRNVSVLATLTLRIVNAWAL